VLTFTLLKKILTSPVRAWRFLKLPQIFRFCFRLSNDIWNLFGPNDFVRMIWVGLLVGVVSLSGVGALLYSLSVDLPDLDHLKSYEPRLTTRILDQNDVLLTELYTQRRLMVPLDRVPEHTISAILATEDRRFNEHWGMDIIRVVSAAVINITTFSVRQGASTITQQLARDLYLHKRQTFARKIKEVLTALDIEHNYSKREILEMYLTQIYFGHGAYGIGSAAQKYFGKQVENLKIAESALLAALPKAPSRYSPRFQPERALKRRNLVLKLMLTQGKISNNEYLSAIESPIELVPRQSAINDYGIGPYFTEMIRQKLSDEGRRLGFDYLEDGITVRTTLRADLQVLAEAAIADHLSSFQSGYRKRFIERSLDELAVALYDSAALDEEGKSLIDLEDFLPDSARIDSLYPTRSIVQVALIAIEPKSGDILAMVGGRDFVDSKFNRVIQAVRQPGSIFKPFSYIAAIDNGYPPTFQLLNQDVVITNPDGSRWVPQNYDLSHGGLTTLREALKKSLNLVSVRLVQEVVPPSMVVRYARQLGISTSISAVDAIALGASGVYPIEITSAFGALAAGGILSTPRSLVSVSDRFGDVISEYPSKREVALSAETSYIISDMLATAINRGTGGSVRWRHKFYKTAAGKTGTTNDYTDAWFVGFTPELVCGVWVGLDDPAESLGHGQTGSRAALPIWAKFMKSTYDSTGWKDVSFEMPPGVVRINICDETKEIATDYCPVKVEEVFRQDAQPLSNCKKHRRIGKL